MRVCLACAQRFASSGWECPACGWGPAMRGAWPVFAPDLAEHNGGFSAEFFPTLIEAEVRHAWFRSRAQLIIWALRARFPRARDFLEIGCGTGYVLAGIHAALPELTCAGSELWFEGLEVAAARLPGISLLQMSATAVPFDAEFDVVGAFDVLEHLDDDRCALAEIFQAARPGGGVIVTVPQHRFLWSEVDEHSFHKRRYARAHLVAKLEDAGFRGVRTTSFASLVLPLMMAKRLGRRRRGPFKMSDEFRIGGWKNSALGRLLDLERFLISRGVSMPAGGSLLAVAHKPGG